MKIVEGYAIREGRMKADDKFIKKIRDTIENETYDDLDMDEWEIIETLLDIAEARGKK